MSGSGPTTDITSEFPELQGMQEATVRVHPHKGSEPAVTESKMGGRFLWPDGEPWPECTEIEHYFDWTKSDHLVETDVKPGDQRHNRHFVAVLQVRKSDVPELAFPGNADLMQLLWCPSCHGDTYAPACKVFWRRSADVVRVLDEIPLPLTPNDGYLPDACSVTFARAVEYPNIDEFPKDLRDRLLNWQDKTDHVRYWERFGPAPQTKIGGHVRWFQGPEIPACGDCGAPMEHLLTVESEGGLDLVGGIVFVFICRGCPVLPVASVYQR